MAALAIVSFKTDLANTLGTYLNQGADAFYHGKSLKEN